MSFLQWSKRAATLFQLSTTASGVMTTIKTSSFCKECDTLSREFNNDQHFIVALGNGRGFSEFEGGASDRCPFCSVIVRRLRESRLSDLVGVKFQVELRGYGFNSIPFSLRLHRVNNLTPEDQVFEAGLEFRSLVGKGLRSAVLAADHAYPAKTDAELASKLINPWYLECTTLHSNCVSSASSYQPPRLLEIHKEGFFRLISAQDRQITRPYVTLSHCWGIKPSLLKLTSANKKHMQQWNPLGDLPRTFNDAAQLCRLLSIDYLWIDSLCIIQEGTESAEDWSRHVTEMRVIYSNCAFTIAASHAASSEEGLWTSRTSDDIRPKLIMGHQGLGLSEEPYLMVEESVAQLGYPDSPLNYRGWVFQERLLSPRVVHFESEQIYWECYDGVKCETYLAGIDIDSLGWLPTKQLSPFKLPTADDALNKPKYWNLHMYTQLVTHYCRCRLTYPDNGT